MKSSISNVLETMFFLPLEFSSLESAEALRGGERAQMVAASLKFSGPFSGVFYLYLPANMAGYLTSKFLGQKEENITHEQVEETVKEILNMIAGDTFNKLDDHATFNLGIPERIPFDERDQENAADDEIFIGVDTLEDRLACKMVLSG